MKEKANTTNVCIDKVQLINKIFAHLRGEQIVETKKDLANILKVNEKNFVSATNGNMSYLTDNLFEKIYKAFPETRNIWKEDDGVLENSLNNEIRNKPQDEQMQMLYDQITELKIELDKIRTRDGQYLEAIAAKLGIDLHNENLENLEKEKSSSN